MINIQILLLKFTNYNIINHNNIGLHNYNQKEGEGVPLNTFDQKDKDEINEGSSESKDAPKMSFFEMMNKEEERKFENIYKVKKNHNIKEGGSNMKELEVIEEEGTTPLSEWKTTEKDTSRADTKNYGKSVRLEDE